MLHESILHVREESPTGAVSREWDLAFSTDIVSVRELIRRQVFEEVENYNRKLADRVQGLLMGRKKGVIDPEKQVEAALAAFENNGFFILVNDHQVQSLDDRISIGNSTRVSFIKLVPLVGG